MVSLARILLTLVVFCCFILTQRSRGNTYLWSLRWPTEELYVAAWNYLNPFQDVSTTSLNKMNNILVCWPFVLPPFLRYMHLIGFTCGTHDTHTHTHEGIIPDMFTQTKLDLQVETLGLCLCQRIPYQTPSTPPHPPSTPTCLYPLMCFWLNPGEGSILGTKLQLGPSCLSVYICAVLLGSGQCTACGYNLTSRLSSHNKNIPTIHSHRWYSQSTASIFSGTL